MKSKVMFFCSECGHESSKWMGKCPACNAWNSFTEELVSKKSSGSSKSFLEKSEVKKLKDITVDESIRIDTSFKELNKVFGSGIVKGSISLIGGEPGIGKSTIIMQICNNLAKHGKVLYVSGEESESQVKLRSDRLKVDSDNILFLNETNINEIENKVSNVKPEFCIIDSIQTMYNDELTSASGSVSQVKEVTARLMYMSKLKGITTLVIGHVTKDGQIAGPRVLEHMVDTVIYIEGDRLFENRIIRTVKNRFGSTNEIGIFKMEDIGMIEISNPSEIFLSSSKENLPGNAITTVLEGNSVLFLEIGALTSTSFYNIPRRVGNGIDNNRIAMLLAVIEKRGNLLIGNQDVYISAMGGIKIVEPASDLAIIASMVSSYKNIPLNNKNVYIGEVGLTGRIRNVVNIEKRIKQAENLGYENIYVSSLAREILKSKKFKINVIYVNNIKHMIDIISNNS